MANRRRAAAAAIWDSPDSISPNLAAPRIRTTIRKLKMRRGAFYAVVILCTVAGLVGVTNIVSPSKTTSSAAAGSIAANSSVGKASAIAEMNSWLASTPAPLPGGSIVSWDGYTVLTKPTKVSDGDSTVPAYDTEVDEFTLSAAGVTYTSTVLVNIDTTHGLAAVVGTPSLMPKTTGTSTALTSGSVVWPGYTPVSASDSVSSAVSTWAKAFVSGDSNQLLQVTGDPTQGDLYVPLSGASSVSDVSVSAAGVPTPKSGDQAPQDPAEIIARVTFSVDWSGAQADTRTQQALVTYDVLVERANTASPVVVAWGGAGSGPTLTKYGNAINGATVQSTGTSTAAPTTVPTSVPSSSQTGGN